MIVIVDQNTNCCFTNISRLGIKQLLPKNMGKSPMGPFVHFGNGPYGSSSLGLKYQFYKSEKSISNIK